VIPVPVVPKLATIDKGQWKHLSTPQVARDEYHRFLSSTLPLPLSTLLSAIVTQSYLIYCFLSAYESNLTLRARILSEPSCRLHFSPLPSNPKPSKSHESASHILVKHLNRCDPTITTVSQRRQIIRQSSNVFVHIIVKPEATPALALAASLSPILLGSDSRRTQ
jgi:hypothetical protein